MTYLELPSRYRRVAMLFAAALALLPACGSKDQRPLVLVDAQLGTYAGAGTTVKVTVTLDGQPTEKSLPSAQANAGKIGIYLPAGTSGNATIKVDVIDASGCVIASGSTTAPVAVKAGETTAAVSIILSQAGSCGLDGGAPDGGAPAPVDSGVADSPGGETPAAVDSRLPVLDGPPTSVDVQPVGQDAASPDLASPVDAKPDVAVQPLDAPVDLATPDLLAGPDLGPDGPVDAPPTTMNVLSNCTAYTHSVKNSLGVIADWGIRQLAFSPDGKSLISFGEDGRAKVWNVTAGGLVAPSNGLVFSGTHNSVRGAFAQDGKSVAVGDDNSQVTVYDFALSMQFGVPSKKMSLPIDTLSPVPNSAALIQFTTDLGHLVVLYSGYLSPDPNQFAVWDLGTQQIVRLVKYAYDDPPMAVFPGDYTGAMWVASAASITGDAGGYVSTVTLMDVSQASPSKAQVTMPGYIEQMAFSPDGTTLAIGFDSGEVSLWDITTKSNIVRLGSPLIAGTASTLNEAYTLAYTPDGKYLAAGIFDYSVNLVRLQQKQALQKAVDYLPWSLAFAPDGLGLAIGERDYGVLLYCRP
jgi:WD40 repeat protein